MNKASAQFEVLLNRYFKKLFAEHPTYAAHAGIRSARGKLGQANPQFEKRWHTIRLQTLTTLDSLSPGELPNDQQLDRLAFRSQLLREREDFDLGRHTLDPNALDHVLNILLHELQRGEDAP